MYRNHALTSTLKKFWDIVLSVGLRYNDSIIILQVKSQI